MVEIVQYPVALIRPKLKDFLDIGGGEGAAGDADDDEEEADEEESEDSASNT